MKKKKSNPLKRSLIIGLSIILAVIVYAYGFTVTKVNLAETKSEIRQTQLIRIIRALAKPDLVEYVQTEVVCHCANIYPVSSKNGPDT